MRFIDEAKIRVQGGSGGSGSVHWRREKFIPRGGPDGGDGGNGGAIIFLADENLNTLIDFSFHAELKASDGEPGGGNQCAGRDGEDFVVRVPVGTQVYHNDTVVADLSARGARWVAARGGRGGKGNAHFRSATNQAPDFAQAGVEGEIRDYRLELKSVADVGLVGFPNAGKSTFLGTVSEASPKVADYPFTTLRPNLGVVKLSDNRRFVIADIPGLIPGASEGKGLGLQFLRHIERTTVLVFLVDLTNGSVIDASVDTDTLLRNGLDQFEALQFELGEFSGELLKAPCVVMVTKGDLEEVAAAFPLFAQALREKFGAVDNFAPFLISSHQNKGLREVLERLDALVRSTKQAI